LLIDPLEIEQFLIATLGGIKAVEMPGKRQLEVGPDAPFPIHKKRLGYSAVPEVYFVHDSLLSK
jgi:hypothetical protein